jgi:hypothetical protein
MDIAPADLEEQNFILTNLAPSLPQKRLALGVVSILLFGFIIVAGPLSTIRLAPINRLVLPEPANYFIMEYLGGTIRWLLGAFLVFYFLPDAIVQPVRLSRPYQALLYGFKFGLAPILSAVAIAALAAGLVNHYAFNLRDSFGNFCSPTSGLGLANDGFGNATRREIIFDISPTAKNLPNNLCVSTGIYLKTGNSYTIGVYREPQGNKDNPKEGVWTFWREDSFMGGQPISQLPWYKAMAMTALYPLRRTLDRGWYSVILRVGSTGSEEDFLDHSPPAQSDAMIVNQEPVAIPKEEKLSEVFRPMRDGELYVYVNKPVLGWPGHELALSDWIGGTGRARVVVTK